MINEKRLLDTFIEYVKVDSESGSEGEIGKKIAAHLKRLGCEVEIDDAGSKIGSNGGNVIARFGTLHPEEPIILSAHMDTVVRAKG